MTKKVLDSLDECLRIQSEIRGFACSEDYTLKERVRYLQFLSAVISLNLERLIEVNGESVLLEIDAEREQVIRSCISERAAIEGKTFELGVIKRQ